MKKGKGGREGSMRSRVRKEEGKRFVEREKR
jgi:hypothetical protein